MITRLTSFLVIVLAALLLPWWATLVGIVYYTRWYAGLELVVAMVLVDGYLGVLWSGPYLTLGAVLMVSLGSVLRAQLRTHTHVSL